MMKMTRILGVSAGVAMAAAALGATDARELPAGIADRELESRRLIATAMLPMMPAEHRAAIVAAGGIGSEAYLEMTLPTSDGEVLVHDERYEALRGIVSPALFARMSDTHLESLLFLRERAKTDLPPNAQCFAPGTDPELIAAYELLFREQFWNGNGDANRFNLAGRWTSTATDSFSTGQVGTPITLTYSYAPDGSVADNLSGSNRSSQLFSWMNSLYGSTATWQALFDSVFDNWGSLTGITYIHEPNDDGVESNTLPGSLGVRGDVRIFAINLDGNFNVLAYNQFPNGGDMVLDAFDSFYNNTSLQSRNLRNVAAHEHGHGLGLAHVCPQNGTKLMEPSANTNFNGIQLDEILAGQRNYGDPMEPNDSIFEANDLGSWFVGRTETYSDISIDDNSDVDYFLVEITQPMELVVEVTPDAGTYRTGPQNFNGSCSAGTNTNFDDNQNLSVELVASNGTTQIGFSNSTSAGQPEEMRASVVTPGTYYVIIDDSSNNNSIQRYRMDIAGEAIPFDGPTIAVQGGLPASALPGEIVNIDFEVLANSDTIIDGPDVLYRLNGGAFTRVAMAAQGGNIFRATIPAAVCDDSPEYYIEVVGDFVGAVNLPQAGSAGPASYGVGSIDVAFSDNFSPPQNGWSDSVSTASAGDWDIGSPDGTSGMPGSDFDGSGACYVTGPLPGVDVDGGRTLLRTPPLDFTAGGTFSYAYYLSSNGEAMVGDSLRVEVSFNGQITWTELADYDAESAGWQTASHEIDAADGVASTYFRFIAEDVGINNTLEAGVDAVSVSTIVCEEPQGCNLGDIAEPFGVLDLGDINAFIAGFTSQDPIADIAAPFGVWDLGDIGAFVAAFTDGCP
jgi:hypothetical protein